MENMRVLARSLEEEWVVPLARKGPSQRYIRREVQGYRFCLGNLINSGIYSICVLTQFRPSPSWSI
jgi:hypothetical protein